MNTWKNNVKEVKPYVPGEQPSAKNIIKLNTNENPYPPSDAVKEALKNMDFSMLRLYPKPGADELTEAIAEYNNVKPENVFVGVGSDDVLATAFLTFFNSDKPVLFPDITYSFYPVWAKLYGIPFRTPEVTDDFRIRQSDYMTENGGIVIANPNAPTGISESVDFFEEIIKNNPGSVVIIDEAYVDFGAESVLPLVQKYDNLLVVQTFSKSRSMAGIRIGYAIGQKGLIDCMMAVRNSINSYTMNYPSIVLGTAAIKDRKYFEETRNRIIETREKTAERLTRMGFTVLPSKTNFLFVTNRLVDAKHIFTSLREMNIFVRYFDMPKIDNYLRITIGTDKQMQKLIEALEFIVNDAAEI